MSMKPNIGPDTVVQRTSKVLFSQVDDEFLGIDSEAGFCYGLNEVSARVWELIEAPISAASVCAALRQEYDVDDAVCRRDVIELLQKLSEAGLIRVE